MSYQSKSTARAVLLYLLLRFILARLLVDKLRFLGFSGSARGEDEIAEYIKKLDMSVFVYAYDHNAPSVEHLKNTHKRMFDIVRNANPQLPIVILSRPVPEFKNDEEERFNVIKQTYQSAKESGDNNVYFVDGRNLISNEVKEIATVDGCHPNDNGFLSMAQKICELLKEIL